jgi:alkylation response protein AidB-like acyl-CoA dehydrogenase
MTGLPTPREFLPDEAFSLIDAHAGGAEYAGDLVEEVVDLVYREGWFKMLTPQRWDGKALPLPQVVRLEEGLAYADGSLGWVVTLCSGAGWFGGFLPQGPFDQVLGHPRMCIAGSGSATGVAHIFDDGFIVSGNWSYASGIRHATAYTANCVLWKDGVALQGADGKPLVRPFLFLPGEVKVRDDWNAMGLMASGSHGFSAKELALGSDRAFTIDPSAATDANRLYQYPFLTLAEATLAANISGMGWRFLDCCTEYFKRREMPAADALLATARAKLAFLRGEFYRALERSWEALGDPARNTPSFQETSADPFAETGRLSRQLVSAVREWVYRLYPFAGLGAARMNSTINRVWRDLNTAGQHPLLVF